MFLDKNRDMLRPDLLDLLQGSKSKVCSTYTELERAGWRKSLHIAVPACQQLGNGPSWYSVHILTLGACNINSAAPPNSIL